MVPFVRLSAEDLTPEHDDCFMDVGIVGTLEELAWGDPIILKGPKGTGKTLAIEEFCATVGSPRVRITCHSETPISDLIGTYNISGGDSFLSGGAFTTAVDVANEYGACVLIVEEINALPPEMHTSLFSLCDFRRSVEVPKMGRLFKVNKGVNFWVVGTMNPGYGGTYHLNEALQSRFNFAEVSYMDEADEKRLLEQSFSTPVHVTERRVIDALMTISGESRSGEWDYALSLRDLVYLIRVYEKLGKERMLKILEAKFDVDHRDAIRKRIQSVFNVNLAKVDLWKRS